MAILWNLFVMAFIWWNRAALAAVVSELILIISGTAGLGHYVPKLTGTIRRLAVTLFVSFIVINSALVICIAFENYFWTGFLFFLSALLMYLLYNVFNKIIRTINAIGGMLPGAISGIVRFGQPDITKIIIVTTLLCGIDELCFPDEFFSSFGIFIMILGMIGVALRLVFPAEYSIAPYVVMAMIILTVSTKAAWMVFPTELESLMIWRTSTESRNGYANLLAQSKSRKNGKVVAEAKCWDVELYSNGNPKTKDGIAIVNPDFIIDINGKKTSNQRSLVKDQPVKVVDKKIGTIDAGEPLVLVFIPNDDGTWVQVQGGVKRSCWVAASKIQFEEERVSVTSTVTTSTITTDSVSTTSVPTTTRKYTGSKTITVDAKKQYTDTGIDLKAGQVVSITYNSGTWSNTNDSGSIWSDANGGGRWPGTIIASGNFRALIGYTSNGPFVVGNNYNGNPGPGRLKLGMNDKEGTFYDNAGSLTVTVTTYE
jgi:hypothetical protein